MQIERPQPKGILAEQGEVGIRMDDNRRVSASRKALRSAPLKTHKPHPDGAIQRLNSRKQGPENLQAALDQCRRAAREGYLVAEESLDQTAAAIQRVSRELQNSVREIERGRAQTNDILAQLRDQQHQVVAELHDLQLSSRDSLDKRRQELDEFHIALFGRTMAGKSTLMEILTNGTGASIGKGAQRTTRAVRSYHWQGLKVTDVPGVAAFEGAEDEDLAFQAAEMADLVLFLITDDAPQSAEAECLARVRKLGKPVLGVCNVKAALEDEDDVALFLRSPEKWFDKARLGSLVAQFHELADRHIPGYRVRFVYTHLLSRFLARQDGYLDRRGDLERASNFQSVENRVINEVVGRGKFLRMKSFIDGAAAPLLELNDRLLEFSAQNSSGGRVLVDKRRQAISWEEEFRRGGQDEINTFITKHVGALRDEIPSFTEDNYDRDDAGKRWSCIVERHNLRRHAQKLQEQLQDECRTALMEIARELEAELKLVGDLAGDRKIAMDPIFDGKRAWNWGTALLSGGLVVMAVILGSTPIGWAAAVVGVAGWLVALLLEDRELKARRQRDKLEERLNKNVDNIERGLRKGLGDWFNRKLLHEQIGVLITDLGTITSGLFQLADAQRNLAWTLNREQKKLHQTLLREALKQLGHPELSDLPLDVARVPGLAIMLVIEPGTIFPGDVRSKLEDLLGERIWFVVNTGNRVSTISQAIGRDCDRRRVSVEEHIQVAHVPIEDLNAVVRGRIRLAQQLTELHVMR